MPNDFDTSTLEGEARTIADTIVAFLTEREGEAPSGGGCRAFYSPEAWEARGEDYGTESVLVLVHDGGALAPYCNYDYGAYGAIDALTEALEAHGYYVEACTCWYSAVYPTKAVAKPVMVQPAPVPAVVNALTGDLSAALNAARRATHGVPDGGTCNFDTIRVVKLPDGASEVDFAEAARRAGLHAADGRQISPLINVQGAPRTVACEAMAKVLGACGWGVAVHYVMD